jgi:hypothetical protein
VNFPSSKTAPPEPDSTLAGRQFNFMINNWPQHENHTLRCHTPEAGAAISLQRMPRPV